MRSMVSCRSVRVLVNATNCLGSSRPQSARVTEASRLPRPAASTMAQRFSAERCCSIIHPLSLGCVLPIPPDDQPAVIPRDQKRPPSRSQSACQVRRRSSLLHARLGGAPPQFLFTTIADTSAHPIVDRQEYAREVLMGSDPEPLRFQNTPPGG